MSEHESQRRRTPGKRPRRVRALVNGNETAEGNGGDMGQLCCTFSSVLPVRFLAYLEEQRPP